MFFATSHGKQPCDGTGSTMKQLVSNASLQCSNNPQILNPHCMFQYCKKKNIEGIKFIFITKDELTKTQESLEDRLQRQLQFQVLGVIMNSYHLVRIPLL